MLVNLGQTESATAVAMKIDKVCPRTHAAPERVAPPLLPCPNLVEYVALRTAERHLLFSGTALAHTVRFSSSSRRG